MDLNADRSRGRLLVRAIHLETDAPTGSREALVAELDQMAGWLGISRVEFT